MLQNDTALLIHHVMRQELAKQNQIIKAALTGQRSGLRPPADGTGTMQMTETRVHIGLNDAERREQLYETETYLGILKDVCRSYHVAFTVDVEEGGYYHEDGEYTEEASLVLVLINAEQDIVKSIARDLRTLFHQESVLVTEHFVGGYFICEEAQS